MICRSCNTDKDKSEFYTRRVRMSSGEIKEGLQSKCISCFKTYKAARDPQHVASVKGAWRSKPENRAKSCEYAKQYRANHPETADAAKAWLDSHKPELAYRRRSKRAANPEHEKVVAKVRRLRDPDKFRAYNWTRRAYRAAVENSLTRGQWLSVLAAANGCCAYCKRSTALSMDHIVPISRGGPHASNNVAAACKSCNSSKGRKLLTEWIVRPYTVLQSEVSPDAITVTAS